MVRSAVKADLHCLENALDRPGGLFSMADAPQLHAAKDACKKRLKAIEHEYHSSFAEPALLIDVAKSADYGHELTRQTIQALEAAHGTLPPEVREVFEKQWFTDLCGFFHHEITFNQPVANIYLVLSTGRIESKLESVESKVDEIRSKVTPGKPGFTYALPELGLFVGREKELETVRARWMADRKRPLLIHGPPGIGKSTLALALLHDTEVEKKFGARRYRLRCDPYTSAMEMIAAMGSEWFGLEASSEIAGEVTHKLREGRAAVVVDNFESLLRGDDADASERWLQTLLGVPELWLIVGVQGHGRPGTLHWASFEPSRLPLDRARELFCEITQKEAHRGDPRLDVLLLDMDGVPHAIELLARQAAGDDDLGPLAARWTKERTALLKRGKGGTRETSIEAAYEFAIRNPLLGDDARRLLRILACLPAGLAEADLDKVMEDGSALDAAAALKVAALVYSESGRLRMLAPLRDYVRGSHAATAEELHLAHKRFLGLAEAGRGVGAVGGREIALLLTLEYANAHWAVCVGLDAGDVAGIKAALGLAQFIRLSGLGGLEFLERARDVARQQNNRAGEADCIQRLGKIALWRSEHEQARAHYQEALPIYREIGAKFGEANCIMGLGDLALARTELEEARARYQEALPIYREIRDKVGEANCIRNLGDIALRRSEHEEARTRYQEALPLYREIGVKLGEANCIQGLGDIAFARSELDQACACYQESLPLYREVGDKVGEANCIRSLGGIALARSEHDQARARYQEALPIYREIGAKFGEANCIQGLGDLALARSEHEQARARYQEALPLYREVGDKVGEANCIQSLGDIALQTGNSAAAGGKFVQALDLYRSIPELYSIGWALRRLAILELDLTRRRELLAEAAECWTRIDRGDLVGRLRGEFPGDC